MTLVTAVLTHLPRDLVEGQLRYLRALSPGSRFVVGHGGPRSDFDDLQEQDALFVEDPSLRGPHFDKSLNETLALLYERFVRDDPTVDLVYVIEYDHLILRPDFEQRLRELAESSAAGLFGKNASPRNDTNWPHYLTARDDAKLNGFIARVSQRDDPGVRYGCLGTGLLLRRAALEAFCAMEAPPLAYVELFVPTAIYHLGFEIADVDAVSDLYTNIRWLPEFGIDEAMAAKRAGATFVHPFKQLARLGELSAAP